MLLLKHGKSGAIIMEANDCPAGQEELHVAKEGVFACGGI